MKIEEIFSFENLYTAHLKARKSKRDKKEVIEFEMNLSENLIRLSQQIVDGKYKIKGYYSFAIYDPKYRIIHALHYQDRVVQHCLCDNYLAPLIDRKLIYDNAACRINKGTLFALKRVNKFLYKFHNKYGTNGYVLKCDIRKFFDNIDHDILKSKLQRIVEDSAVLEFIYGIIDSYEYSSNKGLPLGNQTSQWFAINYLDGLDRYIKEELKIKYYSRYMDDFILLHYDKDYLRLVKTLVTEYLNQELKLEFNEKTIISPLSNGINYLGWHFYLNKNGKIIRKLANKTKTRYKRRIKYLKKAYALNNLDLNKINEIIQSYHNYLKFGYCYQMEKNIFKDFILIKSDG